MSFSGSSCAQGIQWCSSGAQGIQWEEEKGGPRTRQLANVKNGSEEVVLKFSIPSLIIIINKL